MVIMPIQDNVILKLPVQEKEKKTTSGIIITPSQGGQEMPEEGIVVAIGTGRLLTSGERIKPEVKVGNKVIFNKFAGTKIQNKDGEYLIIKENDILAIIDAE